jgi:hypothetical protein
MTETTHRRPRSALDGAGKAGWRLVGRLTRRHIPVRTARSAGEVGEPRSATDDSATDDSATEDSATDVRNPTDHSNPGGRR